MKMAKPSQADIDAAGDLMVLLDQIDRGDVPGASDANNVSEFFDDDNIEHLRAFYLAVKATLDAAPGYQGRVIAGMCYVIMYEENEIVDPASRVLDLHPKLVAALQAHDALQSIAARDVLVERGRQVEAEGYDPDHDDAHVSDEIAAYAAYYVMPPAVRDWPAEETGHGATWGAAIIPEGWGPPKPGDRRRELVKAGALVLAEIERIDRGGAHPGGLVCDVPPSGWYCTRVRGHDGPCAAHPADIEHDHSDGGHHD
nr:hypothetical protein [uncultured Massilia sp.]